MADRKRPSQLASFSWHHILLHCMKRKTLDNEDSKPSQRANPKPVLTEVLISRIAELATKGLPLDAICDFLGIWQQHLRAWLKRGESFSKNEGGDEKEIIYYNLFISTRRAFAQYRIDLIEGLGRHRDWPRALATLERIDRKNYSKFDLMGGGQETSDPDEKFL